MTDLELYNKAKDAYYNGVPIMEDFEFDELEKKLGLENKSYVGSQHSLSHTVKHPFIMGSLSKIQIHEKNGKIDFSSYVDKIKSYLSTTAIITPKYDGCAFEAIYENGKIKSISTRGDGTFGKDIYQHIYKKVEDAVIGIMPDVVLRGEVLINKSTFAKKYSNFVNPRSFVSGVLNNKIENLSADEINDLSIVIYDIRTVDGKYVNVIEWTQFKDKIKAEYLPKFYKIVDIEKLDFENIYKAFEKYRNEICEFTLDGFVIKPSIQSIKLEIDSLEARPKNCVAIKFVSMLQETEVVDIEWNVSKNGEYKPVVITKPVIMDGKSITRAIGSNYGNLCNKKISIGSKVILSLAGNIIPFIYKVTDTEKFDELNLNVPTSSHLEGIHLMATLSPEEISKLNFMASASSLGIPNLGEAETNNIWNYLVDNYTVDNFFESYTKDLPNNILEITSFDVWQGIVSGTKNGASGKANKIMKEFEKIVTNLTLTDVIKSCNFKLCGSKVSEQCANYLIGLPYDFSHLASEGYEWCKDKNSKNYKYVMDLINKLGRTLDDFKVAKEEASIVSSQIPVILTGEPNNYRTKVEFLKCNPQYRMTTSWKEVKIVFTNSLDSNTGKMKQARAKGIEIQIY